MDEADRKITCLACERERRRTASQAQSKPVVRVVDFDVMHHVLRPEPPDVT